MSSLDDVFKTPKRRTTPMSAALFMLLVVVYPIYLVGIAWLITISVTSLVNDGITVLPIIGLVIALRLVARWWSK